MIIRKNTLWKEVRVLVPISACTYREGGKGCFCRFGFSSLCQRLRLAEELTLRYDWQGLWTSRRGRKLSTHGAALG